MESQYLHNIPLISHIIGQMIDACRLITTWNEGVVTAEDYLVSPEGMQKMEAPCMLIESIGERVKEIDRLAQGLLLINFLTLNGKKLWG